MEPVVQSRTNMLQISVICRAWPGHCGHKLSEQLNTGRGVRQLLEMNCLQSIKRWNSGRGANRLTRRCRIVSVAHGSALCIANELGVMSKPALEHVIVVDLAMNFPEINRSGGSWGFVAGRIVLNLCLQCKILQLPCVFSKEHWQALPCLSCCLLGWLLRTPFGGILNLRALGRTR